MPRKSAAALDMPPLGPPPRLHPPDDLTGREREVFVDIVASCTATHFQPQDLPLLCAYARALVLERLAAAQLEAEGYVITGAQGARPSPWLAVLAQATKSMLALSHRLRLSPQGRSPTNPKRAPVVSYYGRMALEDFSHETE
jgi:phage terminase small subunit